MTKAELRNHLKEGRTIAELFPLTDCQDCVIFKAEEFCTGDQIIYIADFGVYPGLSLHAPLDADDITDAISRCYTGDEFLEECSDDLEKAKYLFWYVDWQSPGSAYPEIYDDEEDAA